MTVEQIRAAIEWITAVIRGLTYEEDGTTLRSMSDEDATASQEGFAEIERLNGLLEHHERIQALADAGQSARGDNPQPQFQANVKSDPFDLSDVRYGTPIGSLRSRALTALEQADQLGDDIRSRATEVVESVGGEAVARVLATGDMEYRNAFGRYMAGQANADDDATLKRAQSLTTTEGGFAVPFTLDPTVLLTNDGTVNPLRSIARTVQISTNAWNGVSSAGATATYKAEAAEMTDDAITLAQPDVPVHRLDLFIPYSFEIGGDWAGFESDMLAVMNDAKARAEATAFTSGSGTDEPTGFVTALDGTASEVAATTPEAFSIEDIFAVEEALGPRFRGMAQWGAERSTYNAIRQFATDDGFALWQRLPGALPGQLIGYNAHEISDMDPASGINAAATADNHVLVLGDWSRFLIVDRVGMNVERVPHLFHVDNNRPSGERAILAWCRNGSDVLTIEAFRILNVATTA